MHLHPMLVHFPIALYTFEFFLLFRWYLTQDPAYGRFARLTFYAAFLLMFPAMAAGLWDAGGLASALEHARRHFVTACVLACFSLLRFIVWRRPTLASLGHVILSGIGVMLAGATGYFGGLLVYE